jgi:uncharacterized membrane protein required for colicin V production
MTPAALDITIAVILFLSTIIAFYRGIIREFFTILGLTASTVGAWKGGPLLVPQFNKWFNVVNDSGDKAAEAVTKGTNADYATGAAIEAAHRKGELIMGILSPALTAKVAAYGLSFLAVFLVMTLLSFFVTRSVQEMGLGFFDRIAGALFGAGRGFLIIFLPYVLCLVLVGQDRFPDWAKNSTSVPLMHEAYAYADQKLDLGKIIEDRGNAIVLKLDKISIDTVSVGKAVSKEENELKTELKNEPPSEEKP